MRETVRQENARIYAEMREEGIVPFHESWTSAAVLIIVVVTTLAAMFLAGLALVTGVPIHAITELFKNLAG